MARIGLAGAALLAAIMPGVAAAQFQPLPATPHYAISPTAPPGALGGSPVDQQILQNYRTQLQQSQRELLQQNPSGLGRDQLEIGRQLNALGPGNSAVAPPLAVPAAPIGGAVPQ